MKPIALLSAAAQVAEQLRRDIMEHELTGEMPGIHQIAAGLLVNHKTAKAALELLEKDGLVVSQGKGKPRRIIATVMPPTIALRVAILAYEPDDLKIDYLLDLDHELRRAGHAPFFTEKTLTELKMDVSRVAKLVASTEADAWVVQAGSRPILEWFAEQPTPVFGLFGRTQNVPIASTGPEKISAMQAVVRHLVSLGHRRIVMMARADRRIPAPGFFERSYLEELEVLGIPTGPYNLPDWEETRSGLHDALDSLFRHTPPTALLMTTSPLTVAVMQYFLQRGIKTPRDVSLVSMDPDTAFAWCEPAISHISYKSRPWIQRIVRWADKIARGEDDRDKSYGPASFIKGGTIGPAKG